MQQFYRILLTCAYTLTFAVGDAALPGAVPTPISPVPFPKPQQATPPTPYVPLPRPVVPPMEKPFGMPGVVGLNNGRWEGTDYLGHLAKAISVDVEVLKGENTTVKIDVQGLQNNISELLKKSGFIPKAQVQEGPPLPFLHILAIVYPVDKDKYVIFCTCRLFERIEVVRKDFKPAGYWQGITWENQNISLANEDQVASQVKTSTENLVTAFIERYNLYNRQDHP